MSQLFLNTEAEQEHGRKALASSVRFLSMTIIFIHVFFVLVDWLIDPDLFGILLLYKVMAVSVLAGVIGATYLWPLRCHYQSLLLIVLITLLCSTFLHSQLLKDPMFMPLIAVVCATFSASVIPWSLRWHLSVLFICVFAIVVGHWKVSQAPIWPMPKSLVISVILCMTSLLLMRFASKSRRELARATQRLKDSEQQALELAGKLQMLANTDYLTGAGNLRSFHEYAEHCFAQSHNHQSNHYSIWVMLMDLDHFKQINDRYGHAVGDEVLKSFVSLCEESLDVPCHLSRVGGEEFGVLLPDMSEDSVQEIAEKIRQLTAQTAIRTSDQEPSERLRATVSIGMSKVAADETDIKKAIRRADLALYHAKKTGRNKVSFWTPDLESTPRR